VCDDGCLKTSSSLGTSGSGVGLSGMHARVAELRAGKEPGGGWRDSARLPVGSARA